MGCVAGLWVGGLSMVFGIGCFPFWIGLDVSLFWEWFVHCWLGCFLRDARLLRFLVHVFRLGVSSVVSTHRTDMISLHSFPGDWHGQGQRDLAGGASRWTVGGGFWLHTDWGMSLYT